MDQFDEIGQICLKPASPYQYLEVENIGADGYGSKYFSFTQWIVVKIVTKYLKIIGEDMEIVNLAPNWQSSIRA